MTWSVRQREKNERKNPRNWGLSPPLEDDTRERLDIQHPRQVGYDDDVKSFKNTGLWTTETDLSALE